MGNLRTYGISIMIDFKYVAKTWGNSVFQNTEGFLGRIQEFKF
jgi:hypothetical protein